jgi:hypothetical protein
MLFVVGSVFFLPSLAPSCHCLLPSGAWLFAVGSLMYAPTRALLDCVCRYDSLD